MCGRGKGALTYHIQTPILHHGSSHKPSIYSVIGVGLGVGLGMERALIYGIPQVLMF